MGVCFLSSSILSFILYFFISSSGAWRHILSSTLLFSCFSCFKGAYNSSWELFPPPRRSESGVKSNNESPGTRKNNRRVSGPTAALIIEPPVRTPRDGRAVTRPARSRPVFLLRSPEGPERCAAAGGGGEGRGGAPLPGITSEMKCRGFFILLEGERTMPPEVWGASGGKLLSALENGLI